MNVLIVGGGIAGLTAAALLKQRGIEPEVVEKATSYEDVGYMISLWPMGNRILHGLQLMEDFCKQSAPLNHYVIYNQHGQQLKDFELNAWVREHGQIGTLPRWELLKLLKGAEGGVEVRTGITVNRIHNQGEKVAVEFSDGHKRSYDLVIGADGIHSMVRRLVFGPYPYNRTGISIFSTWIDLPIPRDAIQEVWGAQVLLGVYPGIDRINLMLALPAHSPQTNNQRAYIRSRLAELGGSLVQQILATFDELEFLETTLDDIKIPEWVKGRVVLIGDAAAAFLPTAGVGASMAMESAAVLAEELARSNAAHVQQALQLYVKRRRKRVDAIQAESRRMLHFINIQRPWVITLRDQLVRRINLRTMLWSISRQLQQPI